MLLRKLSRRVLLTSAIVIALCPLVYSRPQVAIESPQDESQTLKPANVENKKVVSVTGSNEIRSTAGPETSGVNGVVTGVTNDPRLSKTGTPVIGDSIKMVANQLLHSSTLSTQTPAESEIVEDVRTPPKMKNKIAMKQKVKNNVKNDEVFVENSHAGLAIPVTMEELEQDHRIKNDSGETSTSLAGLSTWILLSNPSSTGNPNEEFRPEKLDLPVNTTDNSEITKDVKKTSTIRPKPQNSKNKPAKKPQIQNPKPTVPRRPIIASANKSDLIAGGSAVNENVLNKIKASVLANVQKNKNAALNRTTTPVPHTLISTSPEMTLVTKKDFTTKRPTTIIEQHTSASIQLSTEKAQIIKVKKQKHKTKRPVTAENKLSAQLPMEAKDQEIELEVSTPSTTTKKPKRTTTKRKKNRTKKRKPSSPKPTTSELLVSETKVSNNSKVAIKPVMKQKPISTQIYNYLSREVMPTVGVGIVGLAGLVGLASYFLYPFGGPVRRAYDIHDKKDDLYRHNAEDYAHDGNGQLEEDMLGTVLAGIPTNSNNRVNPYVNQTPHRYLQNKKDSEQNIRYRNVAGNNEAFNKNSHYSQQKTGLAHGVVYSDPINYDTHHETDSKHSYMEYSSGDGVYSQQNTQSVPVYPSQNEQSDSIYPFKNGQTEIVYPAQSAPSELTSYEGQSVNSVYGIKPESNFEPVYPFEGQVYSDTTNNPISTSMYLGSDDESKHRDDQDYAQEDNNSNPDKKPQFVVGNVPKELIQPITPAIVPEHGPRSLNRKKRSILSNQVVKKSIADAIEEILKAAKEELNNTRFNEIDEALGLTTEMTTSTEKIVTLEPKDAAITIVSVKPKIRTNNVYTTTVTDDTKQARSTKFVSDTRYDFSIVPSTALNELTSKLSTKTSTMNAKDFLTNTNSPSTTVLTTTSNEDRPLTLADSKSTLTEQTSTSENRITDSKLSISTATPTSKVLFNEITSLHSSPSTIENRITGDKISTKTYIPSVSTSTAVTENKDSTSNYFTENKQTTGSQSSILDNDASDRKRSTETLASDIDLTTLWVDKIRTGRTMTPQVDTPTFETSKPGKNVQKSDSLTLSTDKSTKTSSSGSETFGKSIPSNTYTINVDTKMEYESTSNDISPTSLVDTSSDTPSSFQTAYGTQFKLTDKDIYHITSTKAGGIPKSTIENISTHPLGTMYSYYNRDSGISSTTHTDNKRDTSTTFKDTTLLKNQNKEETGARTTESELSNEIDVTTTLYKIYEVFTTSDKPKPAENVRTEQIEFVQYSTKNDESSSVTRASSSDITFETTSTTPSFQEITTENDKNETWGYQTVSSKHSTTFISEPITISEVPSSTSKFSTNNLHDQSDHRTYNRSSTLAATISTEMPKNEPTENIPETPKAISTTSVPPPPPPEVSPNYPHGQPDHNHKPQNHFSVLSFLKNLIEFKFRLGMSILQTTSESLARYLRGMENSIRAAAKASDSHPRRHNE